MSFGRSEIVSIVIIVAIVASVATYTFVARTANQSQSSEASRTLGDSENGPQFTDIHGNPFSLEQFDGKVRVVNSWASWCPFCVHELPDLDTLASEYSSNEVVVIAINRKESNVLVQNFIAYVGSPERILFVQDPEDVFYKSIGGFSMPETVFYDKAGNIVLHKRGSMTLDEMRKHVTAALASPETNE